MDRPEVSSTTDVKRETDAHASGSINTTTSNAFSLGPATLTTLASQLVAEYDTTTPALSVPDRLFTFSREDLLQFRRAWQNVHYVLLPLGLMLSLCNVLVFRHRRMRSSSSAATYIVAVNVSQMVYIGVYSTDVLLNLYLPDYATDYHYLSYSMFASNYLAAVAMRGSFLLMCVLSLERLYAVLRPLHVRDSLLSRRPLLFSLAPFALAAAWHVYLHAKYRVVVLPDEDTANSSSSFSSSSSSSAAAAVRYAYRTTWLYQRTAAVNDGFSLAAKILFILVSVLVRLVLSVLTIWALRRHNNASSLGVTSSSSSSTGDDDVKRKRERQMTVSVLTASLASVVLFTPSALHFVFGILFPAEYGVRAKYANLYLIMATFVGSLSLFYFALDFLCFVAASSNYRAVLSEISGRVLLVFGRPAWCAQEREREREKERE